MACKLCGSTERLEVHHPAGRGRGKPTVTLCHACHVATHSRRGEYSEWGLRGWYQLVEKKGPEYLHQFHVKGGLAVAGRPRDEKGRYLPRG